MNRRRLEDDSEPTLSDTIQEAKRAALGILPQHAKAIGAAAIRDFMGRLPGIVQLAYRKLGEKRVEEALDETVDEIANGFLR